MLQGKVDGHKRQMGTKCRIEKKDSKRVANSFLDHNVSIESPGEA
jgi:hypothetical protein